MQDPPLSDRQFDLVLALEVLEHLDDDTTGLKHAIRLLKPGGFLMITVPAFQFLWGSHDLASEHRRRYTRKTLTALLKRGGLQNFSVTYFNTFLFPMAAAVRTFNRLRRDTNTARHDVEGHPGLLNSALARVFGAERHFVDRVWIPAGVSLLATYQDQRASGAHHAPTS